MKAARLWAILCVLICWMNAQGQNYISPQWRLCSYNIHQGNHQKIKQRDCKIYHAGLSLDQQKLAWESDTAWLWNEFIAPPRKEKPLILTVELPADSFEIFVNGKSLGRSRHQAAPTRFFIEKETLKRGVNEIGVKIIKLRNNGGPINNEIRLSPSLNPGKVSFSMDFPDNHVFENTEKISIPVSITSTFPEFIEGIFSVSVISGFSDTVYRYSEELSLNPDEEKQFVIGSVFKPGVYRLITSFTGACENAQHISSFVVDPEDILSPVDKTPDFWDFWEKTKAELSAISPDFAMAKVDSLTTATREVYSVKMQSLGNATIRGWYTVPKKPGKYPAILDLPGYGQGMQAPGHFDESGLIRLALDIRGHGRSASADSNVSIAAYLGSGIDSPETFIYRGAYMDCLRAIDFLYARPEIDTTKIVVYGSSQGGGLAAAAAALYADKIAACVSAAPFLSDFESYFKILPRFYDELKTITNKEEKLSGSIGKTLKYFDVKNMASAIKCPVLVVAGLNDDICPPHTAFTFYNNLQCKKHYLIYPRHAHALPYSWHKTAHDWIRRLFDTK